jgi:hypothetical protein
MDKRGKKLAQNRTREQPFSKKGCLPNFVRFEPYSAQPRGGREAAERRGFIAAKSMGGSAIRPRIGLEKAVLFCSGAII